MYFLRNSELGGTWDGFGGVYVFCGVEGAPQNDFGPATDHSQSGDTVTLDLVPVTREAPFLYLDGDRFMVFVPKAVTETRGVDWTVDAQTGESIAVDEFYIARPTDSTAHINEQLAKGKNLILTPGSYPLDEPLTVQRAGTVVLGLGFATLVPTAGTAAVLVSDVPGVILSGFKIDAGIVESDVLLQVGATGGKSGTASDPTTLTDIHIHVPNPGRATTSAVINQDHVLIEGSWMKRADSGWTSSLADHGLIVNGDNVSVYGMWLEHYQKTQILWNGNHGRAIFLQNEPPYDPPNQAAWMNGDQGGVPVPEGGGQRDLVPGRRNSHLGENVRRGQRQHLLPVQRHRDPDRRWHRVQRSAGSRHQLPRLEGRLPPYLQRCRACCRRDAVSPDLGVSAIRHGRHQRQRASGVVPLGGDACSLSESMFHSMDSDITGTDGSNKRPGIP